MEKVVSTVLAVCMLSCFVMGDVIAKCKPRPVLIEVPESINKYVSVSRCHGHDEGSNYHYSRCVSIKDEDVTFEITTTTDHTKIKKKYTNHILCDMKYVCEPQDTNDRKNGKFANIKNYNVDCYEGLEFNRKSCKCECNSSTHKGKASTNGKKSGGDSVSIIVFVISLLGELVVVVAITYCVFRKSRRDSDGENPVFSRQFSSNSMQQLTNVIKRQCSRTRDGHVEGSVSLLENKNPEDDDDSGSDITHMEINVSK